MKVSLIRARYHSVWEPISLMYISSYLQKHVPDAQVEILDAFFKTDEEILKYVNDSDFVGIGGTTPQVKHILTLTEKIKAQNSNTITAIGGFGPSLQPERFDGIKSVDHICLGEGEQNMVDVVTGKAKRFVSNLPIADIDSIPFPDRDNIDLDNYISIAQRDEGRRVTSVLTQRGCAFGCTFCAEGEFGTIWRKMNTETDENDDLKLDSIEYERPNRVRMRNPKFVVQEMIETRDRFNIEFFKTSDAETNPTKPHFIKLCKEMVEQKLDIPWGCNMRADKLDDEMCEWAVKANCTEFFIGLESGVEEIHQHINKGTTVKMIKNAFKVSRKYGIMRRSYSFIGTPLETHDTIKQTEALIDECDPDVFGVCVLCPYPGTRYYTSEYDSMDWSKVDEYANTFWKTDNLTNEELRDEQARLMEKYKDKLATNFRKKFQSGIIAPTGRVLDSLQQHPNRF
jgi:anaerobic magnesium-protoporphyrin IX monomethyl ester cyclase